MLIMVVGEGCHGSLERSYEAAFRSLGHETSLFDMSAAVDRHVRFGMVGRRLNPFFPVEAWVIHANRELVTRALAIRPDMLIVGGASSVRAGALAQVKASVGCGLVLLWPDPLLRLARFVIDALPLYDLVASYSKAAVRPLRTLGVRNCEYVPLAADPGLHLLPPGEFSDDADVVFVGNHRPEREELIGQLVRAGRFRIKVYGSSDWKRKARDWPMVKRVWQRKLLIGRDLARAVRSARVALNPIDPTNYPSANMRFFEIPCARGVQLCSACPEFEDEFRHGESTFYYSDSRQLPELLDYVLGDSTARVHVAFRAHEKVIREHTYAHRVEQILSLMV